jgi:hypothetical protein
MKPIQKYILVGLLSSLFSLSLVYGMLGGTRYKINPYYVHDNGIIVAICSIIDGDIYCKS